MGELVFRGIQVNEIDMSNELQGQVKLDIEQRASFNVKYTQDMKHCIATCVVDMMNKNAPNDFNFKISVRASFDIEGEMEKKGRALVALPNIRRRSPRLIGLRRSEERRVGKECRSRWSPYH